MNTTEIVLVSVLGLVVVGGLVFVMSGNTAAGGAAPAPTPPPAGTDNTGAYIGLFTQLVRTAGDVYSQTQTQPSAPEAQKQSY